MPQYYFDIATNSSGVKPDPENDKIISIQYQKIDFRSGKPLQDIEILREWKSSEEAIITQFYNTFFRGGQNKWIFIPVGYNLNSAWEYITLKFEQYLGDEFKNKRFHYTIPHIDIESVVILLNGGNFIGARLEKFTKHPDGKQNLKGWYDSENFKAIEEHITTSASSFLEFYQKVKRNMPFILKERKPEPRPAPLPEPVKEAIPKQTPKPIPEPAPELAPKPVPEPEVEETVPHPEPPSVEPEAPTPLPPPPREPVMQKPPEPEVEEHHPEIHEEVEEVHEVEAEEVHEVEVEEAHEVEVEHHEFEVHEYHHEVVEEHHSHEAEFAPAAVEVETHEFDDHAEAVEVEAVEVEADVMEQDEHEVVEVEAVVEEDSGPSEALSPKELRNKLKAEARKKKMEEKIRKKQSKLK